MGAFKEPGRFSRNSSRNMGGTKRYSRTELENKYEKIVCFFAKNEDKIDEERKKNINNILSGLRFQITNNNRRKQKKLDNIYQKKYNECKPKSIGSATSTLSATLSKDPEPMNTISTLKPPTLKRTSSSLLRVSGKKSRKRNTKKRKLTKKKNRKRQQY